MTHEPQQPLNGRPPQEQESFCPYCMSRVAPGQSCPVCGLTQGAYTPAHTICLWARSWLDAIWSGAPWARAASASPTSAAISVWK